jgi:MFS family permease
VLLKSLLVSRRSQLVAVVGRCTAGAGAASLYVPRYIAEVAPPALRGWLGSLNQVGQQQQQHWQQWQQLQQQQHLQGTVAGTAAGAAVSPVCYCYIQHTVALPRSTAAAATVAAVAAVAGAVVGAAVGGVCVMHIDALHCCCTIQPGQQQ